MARIEGSRQLILCLVGLCRMRLFPTIAGLLAAIPLIAFSQDTSTWARGISYTPMPGERHSPFEMIMASSHEGRLSGGFIYVARRHRDDPAPAAELKGEAREDVFWPNVVLQVGPDGEGPWETVGRSATGTDTLKIKRAAKPELFKVQLDAFRPFIGRMRFGRVVLESGEAALVDLEQMLTPPKHE